MPVQVVMADILGEIQGLAGVYPTISVGRQGKNFVAQTNLMHCNTRLGRYDYVNAEADSADLALLMAYQRLIDYPRGEWIESAHTGKRWIYDPTTEGWEMYVDQF